MYRLGRRRRNWAKSSGRAINNDFAIVSEFRPTDPIQSRESPFSLLLSTYLYLSMSSPLARGEEIRSPLRGARPAE